MTRLDSRTWLLWGIAAMVPLLIGRHPVLVLQMLLTVATVRYVCLPPQSSRWGWMIRVASIFVLIGIVFNALTVRSGNQIAMHLPLVGWKITWNAIAYGFVSGIAMLALVLTGITVASGLNWIALARVLPARFAPLAVSGSIAWSFLPAASQSFVDIREAQAARGHRMRTGRDILPIVVPLLDTSLERALTMSEALEARGFGAGSETPDHSGRASMWFGSLLIIGLLMLAYGLSLNEWVTSQIGIGLTIAGALGMMRTQGNRSRTTRYREHRLQHADVMVMCASVLSLVLFLVIAMRDPRGIAFNPYPNLTLPAIDALVLLALVPLFVPALYPWKAGAE